MSDVVHSHDRHLTAAARAPTEAQLRWAQFHHKKGAVAVREKVQRLWYTPECVQDVEGAETDDGNTTEESNSPTTTTSLKKTKPIISRGRRALLRKSKRMLERRHKHIQKFGFRHFVDTTAAEQEEEWQSRICNVPAIRWTESSCSSASSSSNESCSVGDKTEVLVVQFPEKKRKRRVHRIRRATADQARLERFEAAVNAHVSLANRSHEEQTRRENYLDNIVQPSKRWTRPENADKYNTLTFSDNLRWGAMPKQAVGGTRNPLGGLMPLDKGASWLQKTHFPHHIHNRSNGDHGFDTLRYPHFQRSMLDDCSPRATIPEKQTANIVDHFEHCFFDPEQQNQHPHFYINSTTPQRIPKRGKASTSPESLAMLSSTTTETRDSTASTTASDFLRQMFSHDEEDDGSPTIPRTIFRLDDEQHNIESCSDNNMISTKYNTIMDGILQSIDHAARNSPTFFWNGGELNQAAFASFVAKQVDLPEQGERTSGNEKRTGDRNPLGLIRGDAVGGASCTFSRRQLADNTGTNCDAVQKVGGNVDVNGNKKEVLSHAIPHMEKETPAAVTLLMQLMEEVGPILAPDGTLDEIRIRILLEKYLEAVGVASEEQQIDRALESSADSVNIVPACKCTKISPGLADTSVGGLDDALARGGLDCNPVEEVVHDALACKTDSPSFSEQIPEQSEGPCSESSTKAQVSFSIPEHTNEDNCVQNDAHSEPDNADAQNRTTMAPARDLTNAMKKLVSMFKEFSFSLASNDDKSQAAGQKSRKNTLHDNESLRFQRRKRSKPRLAKVHEPKSLLDGDPSIIEFDVRWKKRLMI